MIWISRERVPDTASGHSTVRDCGFARSLEEVVFTCVVVDGNQSHSSARDGEDESPGSVEGHECEHPLGLGDLLLFDQVVEDRGEDIAQQ